jgi:hypothetical protein
MEHEERIKERRRHLSSEVYLELSCHLETLAQDYCAKIGCPDEQALEALLAAAAHFAIYSEMIETFDRVTEKLRAGLHRMRRDNPGFFRRQQIDLTDGSMTQVDQVRGF